MRISIVGTGYVGLVTGAGLAELGNEVMCVDIDDSKISRLKDGKTPFYEKGLEELIQKNEAEQRLFFTTSLHEAVDFSRIIFVAVGTPSTEDGEADLSSVIEVAESLSSLIKSYTAIVIKSTVPVGTLELFSKILERGGKKRGKDFDMAMVPEFLREGDAVNDFFHPTRIVLGCDKIGVKDMLQKLFSPLNSPLIHTNAATAQVIKYASNAFLASRISFINEIANICEKVGVDVLEVARGMSFDKRLGEGYLNPGIGFGGPCLVKDLKALIKLAETSGYKANLLQSILDKNDHQLKTVFYKTREALAGILYQKTVGILGLAFKAGTSDVRNSLSLKLIELLQQEGARIRAYDPQGMDEARNILRGVTFADNPYQVAQGSDALLILTPWDEFKNLDFEKLNQGLRNPIIIDGVNLFDPNAMRNMGFVYKGVGRG